MSHFEVPVSHHVREVLLIEAPTKEKAAEYAIAIMRKKSTVFTVHKHLIRKNYAPNIKQG